MTEELARACQRSAEAATRWILHQLKSDGSFGELAPDLAASYAVPALLLATGRPRDAHRVLDHIVATYARAGGAFATDDALVTVDAVHERAPGYLAGWIAVAAQRAGRYDISVPAMDHLRDAFQPGAGATRGDEGEPVVDLLMTAHLAVVALAVGDIDLANACGEALVWLHAEQPSLETALHLHRSTAGEWRVDGDTLPLSEPAPSARWTALGAAIIGAVQLYQATGDEGLLATARTYAEIALRVGPRVTEQDDGTVAWGLAQLARVTGDSATRALARQCAEGLIGRQFEDGGWQPDGDLIERLARTAEAGIALMGLSATL